MQKVLSNKDGASLIEIVATIVIVSISLILIYNVLNYNVRQNGVNQERAINANIANGALNYVQNYEYDSLYTYLLHNNNGWYGKIDTTKCDTLFANDPVCYTTLSPTINNRHYDENTLYIYVLPFDPSEIGTYTIDSLDKYIDSVDPNTSATIKYPYSIRIIVVVKSSINTRYDYLLEGVSTNE